MAKTPLKRILLIEDEPDIQIIARLALETVGSFTVAVCSSGSEALARAPDFAPDLILLDVMMPGMDGLTTLKALRALAATAATPVIFMTAKVQPPEIAGYKQLGALDVIPKPFEPMLLAETIGAIWDQHQVDLPSIAREGFDALHASYAETLHSKIAQIEATWSSIPGDVWDDQTARRLHHLAHSLAGSGATFGFPAVSTHARALELTIKQLIDQATPPPAEQRTQIERCIAALRQAGRGVGQQPSTDASRPTSTHERSEHTRRHATEATFGDRRLSNADKAENRLLYLVTGDDELAQDLSLQIGYFGYAVKQFADLQRLAGAMAQTVPAALLVDTLLLDHAAAEIIGQIRQAHGAQPIIFMSVRDDLATRLQAVRAGGDAFFMIPINIGGLIDKLDALTEHQEPDPYRILVVDDEVELAEYHALMLRQGGMTTAAVSDSLHVMRTLVDFMPDLILMDMYMPDCNGLELAALIRQHEAYVSIPIVFLSMEANLDMQLEAMHMGGDDFLTKPIQPDQLISAVSSRVRRSRTLRSLMVRDSLTGLLKHTIIKERLEIEVARAQRQGAQLAFAMIDIDQFKRINDTYGHATGDRVIKSLARLLQQRLRKSDVIGRYGGEEFAVLLPDTDGLAALKVLDELRTGFARIRQQSNGAAFYTTFSCGIAEYPQCENTASLIDAADRALYDAKRAGRNRVLLADS